MTDIEFESLGMVRITSTGRVPLVVPERDRNKVPHELVASGGVIFTRVEDRPSLEELLAGSGIDMAILGDMHAADPAPAAEAVSRLADWRDEARETVEFNRAALESGDILDEELSILAAMNEGQLDSFLGRAERLLGDAAATEASWHKFLEEEEARLMPVLTHTALAMEQDQPADDGAPVPPVFSIEDLAVTFRRGAFGGHPPLVDRVGA